MRQISRLKCIEFHEGQVPLPSPGFNARLVSAFGRDRADPDGLREVPASRRTPIGSLPLIPLRFH